MKIYVIIVTFNGESWIKKVLDSLNNCSIYENLKILIIDNHSQDKTLEIVRSYKNIELIEINKNLGFGKANNIGLKTARDHQADFTFLLNQDAWIDQKTLENLINVSKKNPQYGILSPIQLNGSGDEIETKFVEYLAPLDCPGFLSDQYLQKHKDVYEIRFVNAAAWLLTKSCLRKVGGFDPLFYHYGEDEDYVNRSKYYGFKVGVAPNAKVFHDRNFSHQKLEYNIPRNVIPNLINLKNINTTFRSAFLHFLKISIDDILTYIIFRKFKKVKFRSIVLYRTLLMYKRVKKARRSSLVESAFLN